MLFRSVAYRDRPDGSVSKLNTYSDGFKVLRTIFRLFRDYKPFAFFGIFALILAVCTGLCLIPVLSEYFRTGLVPRFPTLIVGTALGICALLSFFTGLILEVSAKRQSQTAELLLNFYEELEQQNQQKHSS